MRTDRKSILNHENRQKIDIWPWEQTENQHMTMRTDRKSTSDHEDRQKINIWPWEQTENRHQTSWFCPCARGWSRELVGGHVEEILVDWCFDSPSIHITLHGNTYIYNTNTHSTHTHIYTITGVIAKLTPTAMIPAVNSSSHGHYLGLPALHTT